MQRARVRGIAADNQGLDPLRLNIAPPRLPSNDPVTPSPPIDLAAPRRGHVLTTVAETYGHPIRAAAFTLTTALSPTDSSAILNRCGLGRANDPGAWLVRTSPEMLAWSLVSVWLTAFATRAIPNGQGIQHALAWFFAGADNPMTRTLPAKALVQADDALSTCNDPDAYLQLLPYVLDPHGPGSRLSIRRNANTRVARDNKRSHGVYYTPSDVAAYMVREAMRPLLQRSNRPAIYDPACGTAVFLRAALATLRDSFPNESTLALSAKLYGTDIDPCAVQAAAFVLLADCLLDASGTQPPIELWRRLRQNLACVDALRLDPQIQPGSVRPGSPNPAQGSSGSSHIPHQNAQQLRQRLPLAQLFPEIQDVPLAIVGNPPYAKLGSRDDLPHLAARFTTLAHRARNTSETFPLFVEQMIRLAPAAPAVGSMVVPLSVASNVGPQFTALRALIQTTPGVWEFAFFDREPHALFGEDVKTRNSILFWQRTVEHSHTTICSGPLRKWRAQNRAAMFSSINFTQLASPIRAGIPKLEGATQVRAFDVLVRRPNRFGQVYTAMRRIPLAQTFRGDGHTVFVAGTAYNFLNVFLAPPDSISPTAAPLSEHPLHAVEFPSRDHALAAFALLSSRISYWWWRVTQDGFHVTGRFLADLPFGPEAFSGSAQDTLSTYGDALWSLAKARPVLSVNRGKASLAFSSNGFGHERTKIDTLLAELAGLDTAFLLEMHNFVTKTITAGPPANQHQDPTKGDSE